MEDRVGEVTEGKVSIETVSKGETAYSTFFARFSRQVTRPQQVWLGSRAVDSDLAGC